MVERVDRRFVTEADVVRARMSVQMTQDLMAEKRRKIEQLEGRIHEKVAFLHPSHFWYNMLMIRVKKVHRS